jgi:hypothetical protein
MGNVLAAGQGQAPARQAAVKAGEAFFELFHLSYHVIHQVFLQVLFVQL